eukprot:scaffold1596_cov302-Pinguiococcus_pyrenoidosus.AAC.88
MRSSARCGAPKGDQMAPEGNGKELEAGEARRNFGKRDSSLLEADGKTDVNYCPISYRSQWGGDCGHGERVRTSKTKTKNSAQLGDSSDTAREGFSTLADEQVEREPEKKPAKLLAGDGAKQRERAPTSSAQFKP